MSEFHTKAAVDAYMTKLRDLARPFLDQARIGKLRGKPKIIGLPSLFQKVLIRWPVVAQEEFGVSRKLTHVLYVLEVEQEINGMGNDE